MAALCMTGLVVDFFAQHLCDVEMRSHVLFNHVCSLCLCYALYMLYLCLSLSVANYIYICVFLVLYVYMCLFFSNLLMEPLNP